MALADIYLLKHFQTFQEQPCLNIYQFEKIDGTGGAIDLADDFAELVLPAVNQIQSTNVENVRLDVGSLGNSSDFTEYNLIGGGALAAESLPAFNAVSFTFKPNDRAVRHGGKRYVGVPESVTLVNKIVEATYLGYMEALRLKLLNNIVGAANTWRPVLVKRIRTTVSGTVPPKYRYAYPKVGDPLTVAGILSVLVSDSVKHQVSRQT